VLEPQHATMNHPTPNRRPGRSDNVIAGAVIALVVGLWGLPLLGRTQATVLQTLASRKPFASTVVPQAGQVGKPDNPSVTAERTGLTLRRDGGQQRGAENQNEVAVTSGKPAEPVGALTNSSHPPPSSSPAKRRPSSSETRSAASRADERLSGDGPRQTVAPASPPTATRVPGTSYVTPEGRTVIVAPPP